MTVRFYGYGELLKPAHGAGRDRAGGDLIWADDRISAETWPPAFVIDGWPPADSDGLAPTDSVWPGGTAWAVEPSPFPPETGPFARPGDIDPLSPRGQWLAGMDRNFGPGWEDWDGVVTVDVRRN